MQLYKQSFEIKKKCIIDFFEIILYTKQVI